MKQSGRGGMGSTKHGKSGYPTRSPRYKFHQQLEANKELKNKPKKPKNKMHSNVKDAFKCK